MSGCLNITNSAKPVFSPSYSFLDVVLKESACIIPSPKTRMHIDKLGNQIPCRRYQLRSVFFCQGQYWQHEEANFRPFFPQGHQQSNSMRGSILPHQESCTPRKREGRHRTSKIQPSYGITCAAFENYCFNNVRCESGQPEHSLVTVRALETPLPRSKGTGSSPCKPSV